MELQVMNILDKESKVQLRKEILGLVIDHIKRDLEDEVRYMVTADDFTDIIKEIVEEQKEVIKKEIEADVKRHIMKSLSITQCF